MQNELVSVISPCYNVGPYIGRFLSSLISQTYKNLEIILVNDGSTDNTGEIIENYLPKLEAEGYKVLYIVQENGGQSSAVNNALKHVTGQYLTWPDPDDWLTPDSIAKRVSFLSSHPDVGLVRCNAELVDEVTENSLGLFESDLTGAKEINHFFEKLVFSRTWFAPVASMIRMKRLDEVIPNREIYVEKKAGQNWQMMLPIAEKSPCWQLPDVLAYYLVRKESHSHFNTSFEKLISYKNMCERVLRFTLSQLNAPPYLIKEIHTKYAIEKLDISQKYGSFVQRLYTYILAVRFIPGIRAKVFHALKIVKPSSILEHVCKNRSNVENEK